MMTPLIKTARDILSMSKACLFLQPRQTFALCQAIWGFERSSTIDKLYLHSAWIDNSVFNPMPCLRPASYDTLVQLLETHILANLYQCWMQDSHHVDNMKANDSDPLSFYWQQCGIHGIIQSKSSLVSIYRFLVIQDLLKPLARLDKDHCWLRRSITRAQIRSVTPCFSSQASGRQLSSRG